MRKEEKKQPRMEMQGLENRQEWKPGNMLYPLPVVMVSCADGKGNTNILTVAWAGTVCTNPPMLSISVRPERYSCRMIQETGEFVVNLTTERLVRATDLCGVKSGRDVNKWEAAGLTPVPAKQVKAPLIGESPVNLECRVEQEIVLGSHILFLARVVSVSVDEAWLDDKGSFHLDWAKPICYSHGKYFQMGKEIGKFGFSVAKKKTGQKSGFHGK